MAARRGPRGQPAPGAAILDVATGTGDMMIEGVTPMPGREHRRQRLHL